MDLSLARSKNKADHKKFAKQLRGALSSNNILTTVATMEATGRLMMDAKTFAQAAEQGKTWISEYDFHRFVENATAEEKARYGDEFGVDNWDGLSYEAFQNTMAEYASSSKSSSLIKQQKRINAAKRVTAENTEAMPTSADNMTDGAHKYATEDGQAFGIIKEGKNYYIYDYASNNISFAQSRADINKLLSDIQAQRGTGDIAAAIPMDTNVSSATDGKDFAIPNNSQGVLNNSGKSDIIKPKRSRRPQSGRNAEIETMENNRFERLRPYRDNLPSEWFAFTDKYFYVYSNHSFTDYTVLAKVKISQNNKATIENFTEELENGTLPSSETFDTLVKILRRGKGRDSWYSVGTSRTVAARRNDGMDGRTRKSDNAGNTQKDGGDSKQYALSSQGNAAETTVEKSATQNDGQSRIDSINPKKIHEYLRENVKGYKALSEPNQAMVRAIIRQGRTLGIPEADLLLYAKVATRSGVNIVFDKEATYLGKDSKTGEDVYADGFYQRGQNRIVVNPEGTRSAERLLIHELTHAIFKTPSGTIILMNGVKNLSQDEKDRITKNYSKLHKNSSGGEISLKIMDEQQAHYAEWALRDRAILEKLVSDKPKLKDMILDFFTKAKSDYAGEDKLDAAAKKLYRQYKKLFDEFSARNADTNAVERTVRGREGKRDETSKTKDISYSLNVRETNGRSHIVNPYTISKEDVSKFLEMSLNRRLEDHTYFPISSHTPEVIISTLQEANIDVLDRPMAMQAEKAKRSQTKGIPYRKDGIIVRHHEMRAEEILETIEKLSNPEVIIQETNQTKKKKKDGVLTTTPIPDRFSVFVTLDSGKECVAVIEFNSTMAKGDIVYDGQGEEYHTTVTVFEPDVIRNGVPFDYVEYLLLNPNNRELNIKRESPKSNAAYGEKFATVSNKELSNNSIPQNQQKSTQNSKNFDEEDYALPEGFNSDTVTVSRGEFEKIKANYQGDKVFYKKDVVDALQGIESMSHLPADVKNGLANDLWRGYNMRLHTQGYDIFTETMYYKLHSVIQQESGFEMSREEISKMDEQIYRALKGIVESGKPSVKEKIFTLIS